MTLLDGQFQIGQVVFGRQTWYPTNPPDWGSADVTVNDVARPANDGIRMGRESRQGRTIAFEMGVLGSGTGAPGTEAMFNRLSALESEWANDGDRRYAQLLKPLVYSRAGIQRRVYGRPRKFASAFPDTQGQWIDVTCDYQTIDHYSYSEDVYYTVVSTVSESHSGVRLPTRMPVRFTDLTKPYWPNPIRVQGTAPAYVRYFFFGPCTRPVVEIVGQFKLQLNISLKSDEWAVIDPAPWSQIARRNDMANLAGYLSYDSPPFSQMKVDPGSWRVNYTGGDRTGTSFVYLEWRSTHHGF